MKKLAFLFFIVSLISCQPKKEAATETLKTTLDYNVAVTFISDYALFLEKSNDETATISWIQNNTLLTATFKDRYEALLEEARKEDPELGLGFDPVLDAQDYPDKDYTIKTIDSLNGFVTVSATEWNDFEVVLKVVSDGNQSKVEGSGVINIPEDRRAVR